VQQQRSANVRSEAPLAQPPQLFFDDIASWAKYRKIGISACDDYVIEPLKKLGIQCHSRDDGYHNPHAFSAACRESAFFQVLAKTGKNLQMMDAWDVYGSSRTLGYNPKFSGPFGKTRLPNGNTVSSRGMEIRWLLSPNDPVQGDASRGADTRVPHDLFRMFDLVVACDIYQCGSESSLDEFSPDFAKKCLHQSKDGTMYWIGRFFPGEMGGDKPFVLSDGSTIVEQVYVKNVDGLVLSSSDEESTPYAPHPWPEWLMNRYYNGLDISPVASVGPYRIVRLAMTKVDSVVIQPIPKLVGDCSVMQVDDTEFWFWLPVTSKKHVVVHVETFLKVSPRLVRKIPHGQLLDMAQVLVSKELDTPLMHALRKRFPFDYRKMVDGTVLAGIYFGRNQDSKELARLRQAHVVSEAHLDRTRAQKNTAPQPWNSRFVASMLILFVAFLSYLFRQADAVLRSVDAESALFGAWIIPSVPLLSAFLEEGLAWFSEPLAVAGVLFELITTREPKNSIGRTAVHLFAFFLRNYGGPFGRIAALILHLGWNHSCKVSCRLSDFLKLYEDGEILCDVEEHVVRIPERMTLPSYTARMVAGPKNFRGKISVFVDGVDVDVAEAFELLGRPLGRNITYPILITNRLLHQPANNETNLLAAVLFRLHNDPFVGNPFSEKERHAKWEKLGKFFVRDLIPDLRCAVCSVEENIRAMGRKGARLERAYRTDIAGLVQFTGKTVNLKWNETITSLKDVNGILTMKPRAIQNLPPLMHAKMGGDARSFADELHRLFDGQTTVVCGVPVRIFFASGYAQARLSEIGRAAQEGHCVFAMSGDDSFVAWGGLKIEFGGEADQSMFDHTQDEGPTRKFMWQILLRLGISLDFCKLAFDACSSGYTIRKGRLFCKGGAGVQLPTGITTTTSFNSMSTLAMFVWFLMNRDRLKGLVDAGLELGFTVKYAARDDIFTSTFLKGWWQQGEQGVDWIPLPSACLKIGKMLNDPISVTRVTRRGKKSYLSPVEAIQQCSSALAKSYGELDRSYPILGEFLFTMIRLGKQPRKVLGSLQESWKPSMTAVKVDRQTALASIESRYGITVEEVESVERLLRTVVALPSYIEHPVFDKLCDVDY